MIIIKSNHANKITLDQVAAHVHLSPAYLSRLFNKKTGRVFTEYLTQVRLEKAKQRLRIPLETIEQIAAATGFSSSSYFSAVFKKYEGITPSQYRSNQK
ncbi:helix-turn-helix transcriptional regulator [Paradesulfitobacterium ferrireducens]|uniref:helix-turn-helix transcriptional regulator n=1 Tax=Paradesulfitobacterium ferrireducens TaxID=2816476 RepID=UPI001A8DB096|nr:helix-turn-helix transcriptional regulator [Paradesulfitobacterium ferrireducens]